MQTTTHDGPCVRRACRRDGDSADRAWNAHAPRYRIAMRGLHPAEPRKLEVTKSDFHNVRDGSNMRNTRSEYFTSDITSITDIARASQDVRDVPLADSCSATTIGYSIISSARMSRIVGISRSSVLAVRKLITRSNRVGCTTGNSPALSPLRMRPT